MKVVTICGSMRLKKEMLETAIKLELEKGFCVLPPIITNKLLNEQEKEKIGKLHYKKIDISDGIYVLNIGGYIGESVKAEIEYAKKHGKEIIYHEETK